MKRRGLPLELLVVFYMLCWVPNIALTKALTTAPHAGMPRPLTGLELLPASMVIIAILMYVFFWLTGWWRYAHRSPILGLAVPRPSVWPTLGGLGTALVLLTVPLSYTFPGVSIPFVMLLMKGGVLLTAPAVDWISGRSVRWFSWTALALAATALLFTIQQRGGASVPALCQLTIAVYIVGYFVRLRMMTRVSKSSDAARRKTYFVEEQLVANPVAVLLLGILAAMAGTRPLADLRFGFVEIWSQGVVWFVVPVAVSTVAIAIVGARILLDERENTFCVALERSASVLAGIGAAYFLAWKDGLPPPTGSELIGAALLIGALLVLVMGPRLAQRGGAAGPLGAAVPGAAASKVVGP